jgi:hypothetical protein
MLGQESIKTHRTVPDMVMVTHAFLDPDHGHGVTTIVVSPQGAAQEQISSNLETGALHDMDIGDIHAVKRGLDQSLSRLEVAVIVFVIAHDHDDLGIFLADMAQEVLHTITTLIWPIEIPGHQDIARQDQDIYRVSIWDPEIRKLEMEI